MNRWIRTLGMLLLLATISIDGIARPLVEPKDFGLKQTNADCDAAPRTYKYVATWQAPAGSKNFTINSGASCRIGSQVCSPTGKNCSNLTCDATGQCSFPLNLCGSGGMWIQVTAEMVTPNYFQYQRLWMRPGRRRFASDGRV